MHTVQPKLIAWLRIIAPGLRLTAEPLDAAMQVELVAELWIFGKIGA